MSVREREKEIEKKKMNDLSLDCDITSMQDIQRLQHRFDYWKESMFSQSRNRLDDKSVDKTIRSLTLLFFSASARCCVPRVPMAFSSRLRTLSV